MPTIKHRFGVYKGMYPIESGFLSIIVYSSDGSKHNMCPYALVANF